MEEIFISYSQKNTNQVKELVELLDAEGLPLYFAKRDSRPGEFWIPKIEEKLKQAKFCLICMGKHPPTTWFNKEIQCAQVRDDNPSFNIIVVLLPGAKEDYVNDFLKIKTWVDLRDGITNSKEFQRLIVEIKSESKKAKSIKIANKKSNLQDYEVKKKLLELRDLRKSKLISPATYYEYEHKLLDRRFLNG